VLLWSAAGALLRHAAGVHFTTEGERDLAAAVVGPVESRVIPLGVDEAYLAAPVVYGNDREPRIVALARLDRKKNLHSLIQAFHAIAGGASEWRLTIAGSGDATYTADLRREAAAGAAASRVSILDWIDGPAKLDLLRHASVFAMPSHQENFGLGALEAMACGVPVIVARGVNLAPAIEHANAGWVTGTTVDELAKALADVMRDEVGRRRRAASARRLAERYTWSAAAAELDAWYTALAPAQAVRRGV